MDYERTGHLIAEFRHDRGFTQMQLAEKSGVLNRTISKWEHSLGFHCRNSLGTAVCRTYIAIHGGNRKAAFY